jgi:hypothetical protein
LEFLQRTDEGLAKVRFDVNAVLPRDWQAMDLIAFEVIQPLLHVSSLGFMELAEIAASRENHCSTSPITPSGVDVPAVMPTVSSG